MVSERGGKMRRERERWGGGGDREGVVRVSE